MTLLVDPLLKHMGSWARKDFETVQTVGLYLNKMHLNHPYKRNANTFFYTEGYARFLQTSFVVCDSTWDLQATF